MLRRLKLLFNLYNFFHRKELTHNTPVYKRLGLRKSYFSPVSSTSFKAPAPEVLPWLDRQDSTQALPATAAFQELPEQVRQAISSWSKNGYAIIPGFLSPEEVDAINQDIDNLLEKKQIKWRYRNKLMFAIHKSAYLNSIGNHPALLRVLSLLLGREVRLFQSINFLRGSEQRTHSDSIHMTTYPPGYMIAVWLALEDTDTFNGPLHYYPGSHTLPYLMNPDFQNEGNALLLGEKTYAYYEDRIEEIIAESPFPREVFFAKKGDILIWHANLLHGGDPQTDKNRTRKSMVFHYFAKDVICYHEISQRPALFKKSDGAF